MSEKYKITDSSLPFFVTFTVVQWIDLFTRNEYRNVLIESMIFCQRNKGLMIHAYCIMTNHLHMIISSNGESSLQDIIRDFRSYTSKMLKREIENSDTESRKDWMLNIFREEGIKRKTRAGFQLWKRNYHPVELSGYKFFEEKLDYIHQNPVKAGFVFEPQDYVYSSAVNYSGRPGLIDVVLDWP